MKLELFIALNMSFIAKELTSNLISTLKMSQIVEYNFLNIL